MTQDPTPELKREWATYILLALANELNVAPADLQAVPFNCIAALHSPDPFDGGRIAQPKRRNMQTGYMSTKPYLTRPTADYSQADFPHHTKVI